MLTRPIPTLAKDMVPGVRGANWHCQKAWNNIVEYHNYDVIERTWANTF